jgi:hypothetical protein
MPERILTLAIGFLPPITTPSHLATIAVVVDARHGGVAEA